MRAFPSVTQLERFADSRRTDRAHGCDRARAPITLFALLRTGDDEWRFVWS